ncbi:hypothetical protein COM45_04810 [Corynebacterium accolens]|uniref:Uncharacterized protein n=1 Tax=Corynebacterium accolens TaxID=38284 RepID=A0A2A4AKW1_9CORY|nr:hypothetical protein COM45_04810 [Corynebacterium accolens]
MPHDPRVYAVITHDFADSPKLQVVSVEARWALLEMILYSCRMQTDGVLSKRLAAAKWPLDVCLELASNDDEKPSLVETENEWIIHDFLEHQTSKAEIEARRKQKQEAGRKGGLARGAAKTRTASRSQARAKARAKAGAKQTLKQNGSKPKAEIRNKKGGGGRENSAANAPENSAETTPIPSSLDELAAAHAARTRCPKHQHIPAGEWADEPCRECQKLREGSEAQEARAAEAEKEARRAAIDACTQCDDLGYVKVANGTVAKCTHQPMKGPF